MAVKPLHEEVKASFWIERRKKHLQQLAGSLGKNPAEPVIASMGSTGPPFVEPPRRICDWIRCDGAQVTRPSIDPYREMIDTAVYLVRGRMRLSMPIFFAPLPEDMPRELYVAFAQAAYSMGVLLAAGRRLPEAVTKYRGRMLVDADALEAAQGSADIAGLVLTISGGPLLDITTELRRLKGSLPEKPLFVRLPAAEESPSSALAMAAGGADGIIIDEDMVAERPVGLEITVAETDRALKEARGNGGPPRSRLDLLAEARRVRGADDVMKLMGLGADAVSISEAALIALGWEESAGHWPRSVDARERLENLLLGLQREIKLLVGAAGVSAVFTSLPGCRELFRSVDLDPEVRRRLQIKPAGVG